MSHMIYTQRIEYAQMITRGDLPGWCVIEVMPGICLAGEMVGTDWAIELLKDAEGKHLQFWGSEHAAWMAVEVYARARGSAQ